MLVAALMTCACDGLLGIDNVAFVDGGDGEAGAQADSSGGGSPYPGLGCGDAGNCAAGIACCWGQNYATSACVSPSNCGSGLPIVCDNGTACSAMGKAGYTCCAGVENNQIRNSSCVPYCDPTSNTILCDPVAKGDQCAGLAMAPNCKEFVVLAGPGYFACQP
jgi:hypothetical protein